MDIITPISIICEDCDYETEDYSTIEACIEEVEEAGGIFTEDEKSCPQCYSDQLWVVEA